MNINGFSASIPATHPLGNRLDVTVNEPAERTSPAQTASPGKQIGSIAGVLTDAENLAFAKAFQASQPTTYTLSGATRARTVAPGMHLDIQA